MRPGQIDQPFGLRQGAAEVARERAEEPWAAPLEAAREVAAALRARRDAIVCESSCSTGR